MMCCLLHENFGRLCEPIKMRWVVASCPQLQVSKDAGAPPIEYCAVRAASEQQPPIARNAGATAGKAHKQTANFYINVSMPPWVDMLTLVGHKQLREPVDIFWVTFYGHLEGSFLTVHAQAEQW